MPKTAAELAAEAASKKASEKSTEDEEQEDVEDDSEEEASEKDEEEVSEKEEEEEEGEKDISKQYFTDPNSLPPELRGAFKKMQGIYTQKMQAASFAIKKADAFDRLVLDPDFRKWMEQRRKGVASSARADKDDSDDSNDDEDAPITRKALRSEIQSALAPMFDREQEAEMRKEAKDFKKNNPGWEIYRDPMMEILGKHPTLGYQEAYDLASRDDNKALINKETIESKKRAKINKPSKQAGGRVEKKGKMTITEAYEAAKRKLGIK